MHRIDMAYADALPSTPPAPRGQASDRRVDDRRDDRPDDKEFAVLVDKVPDKSTRDPAPTAKPTATKPDEATSADTPAKAGDKSATVAVEPDNTVVSDKAAGEKTRAAKAPDDKTKTVNATDAVDETAKASGASALLLQYVAAHPGKPEAGSAAQKDAVVKSENADGVTPADATAKAAAAPVLTPMLVEPPVTSVAPPTTSQTLASPATAETAAGTTVAAPAATASAASASTAGASISAGAARPDKSATSTTDTTDTGPGANRAEAKGDAAHPPAAGQPTQSPAAAQAAQAAASQANDPDTKAQAAGDTTTKAGISIDTAKATAAANATAASLVAGGDIARTGGAQAQTASAPATAAQAAPTMQVAARFIERFDGRAQRFEVRLDPAELGRVDVRIEVGADKKVHAILAAHDSAALSDLMRGSRALEKALGDAGIDVADGGLKFELATDAGSFSNGQNRSSAWAGGDQPSWPRGQSSAAIPIDADTAALATTPIARSGRGASRLDLMA